MRALVIANGEPPSPGLTRLLAAEADLVVAADGGAAKALAAGVTPHAVVGDFDSFLEPARAGLPGADYHAAPDPESTDLQKAIEFCLARGCTEIDVVAAGGGRADHALANLSVLRLFRGRASVRVIDDLFEISLIDGTAEVEGAAGTVVSLVAIGPCRSVTTKGLRWNLAAEDLEFSPRGVHNEIATSPATVTLASGDLLLFRGRWVEKHG